MVKKLWKGIFTDMKILLISTNTASNPYPVFPLGCGIIASVLMDAGYDVKVFDVMAESSGQPDLDGILKSLDCKLREFSPDIAGISIRNIDNVNVLEEEIYLEIPKSVVKGIKKKSPNIPVILGGSGFSIMPERILEFTGADYGIAGEGERLILELVESISAGKLPEDKIIRETGEGLRGGGIKGGEYFAGTSETSKPISSYYTSSGSILPIQTKRGCLNNCVYCTYPFLEGRKLRNRKPEEVVAEMQMLQKDHGADFVFFTDSVFNDADGEYLKIIDAIEKSKIDIPWTAFFQPDPKLDAETVDRMIAAGLHSVELGPDATSNTTLKAIGKKFNFDDVIRCNELFAERHIAAIRENIISEERDLLNPAYYFSPELKREWLEEYLDSTLSKIKYCVYPPNSMDSGIQILRKMGYRGNLWEMMVKDSKRMGKLEIRN